MLTGYWVYLGIGTFFEHGLKSVKFQLEHVKPTQSDLLPYETEYVCTYINKIKEERIQQTITTFFGDVSSLFDNWDSTDPLYH